MRLTVLLCIVGFLILAVSMQCGRSDNITADTDTDLAEPELISPKNRSEQPTSVSFRWHAVEEADAYHIRLSLTEEFASTLADSITESTLFEIEGLPYDTTLYWKVRSRNLNQASAWSDAYTFSTEAHVDNPEPLSTTLKSPADGATNLATNLTLTWTAVANDSGYKVQLATDQGFNAPVINTETDSTSYQASSLSGNKTYYWRVEPTVENRETQWSEVFSFTTGFTGNNPSGDTVRIMPLGNSITEAFGYRVPLWEKLTGAEYFINYVGSQSDPHPDLPDTDHEGHGGWYIGNIAEKVNNWLAAYHPDYVLLMIGTNDVAWWTTRNGAEIADAHARLVDQILANSPPHTWLLVSSIPPQSSEIIEPNKVDRAQLARDFNREMEKRMQQRINSGRQIVFVDIYPRLTVDHLSDGIHPNEQGYEIIAQAWFDALKNVLP